MIWNLPITDSNESSTMRLPRIL